MLKKIFKFGGKVIVIVMLSLLVLSFALWGVADVFRGGTGDGVVAKVGDTEVSQNEFQKIMQQETAKLQERFGNSITPDIIKSLQIENRVIRQLVNDKLFDQAVKDIGVMVGEDPALQEIASIPDLRNEDGTFNADNFRNYLYSIGENEQSFINKVREAIARKQLMDSLTSNPIIIPELVKAVYVHDNERRSAEIAVIPANFIKSVGEPNDNQLMEYYETEKNKFSAPEYRSFSYVVLEKSSINADEEISQEEIEQSYNDRLEEFSAPEKRTVLNILFDSKEQALKAYEKLRQGQDILSVARENGKTEKEITLENISQKDLLPELAGRAFSLDKGGYSEPIETSFGWHIINISDISPATAVSLEKVKDEIKKHLLEEKTDQIVYSTSTKLDDIIAGGGTLEEALSELGLKSVSVNLVDRSGKLKGSEASFQLPPIDNMLEAVFSLQEGETSNVHTSPDGKSYFVVRADKVQPGRIKAIDEVRGSVVVAWKEHKKKELLRQLVADSLEKIKGTGQGIKQLKEAVAAGSEHTKAAQAVIGGDIKITSTGPINRYPVAEENLIPASLISELFSIGKGDLTSYHEGGAGEIIVGRLEEIIKADPDKDEAGLEEIELTFSYDFADDVWEQYLNYLQLKFPVKIFESRISKE